jgi:hypothetical protein
MSFARFFDRVSLAAGRHLSVNRASLEATLGTRIVGLRCGSECTIEGNARWIAEFLVNLLARLYPTLSLQGPTEAVEPLAALARAVNPEITLVESARAADVTVVVGHVPHPPSNAIFPRADGWVARLLRTELAAPPGPPNPYAAAAAAALAASEVFRRVFVEHIPLREPSPDVSVSLLDFSTDGGADHVLAPSSLGEVALAGLGAVGNAGLWALVRHPGLTGNLWPIDREAIELSNLQRYVLAMDQDVTRPKTELVSALLAGSGLKAQARSETLEEFAESFGANFGVPTLCVSVDNVETRRVAQALLPELIVNGWTSDSGLGASWHRFDSASACLACLYHPIGIGKSQTELVAEALGLVHERAAALWVLADRPSEEDLQKIAKHLGASEDTVASWRGQHLTALYTNVVCGMTGIDLKGRGHREAVPLAHQSALAGVLMAAELVKRTDSRLARLSQPQALVAWDDVLGPPPQHWTRARQREAACICGDPVYQNVYAEKWRKTSTR